MNEPLTITCCCKDERCGMTLTVLPILQYFKLTMTPRKDDPNREDAVEWIQPDKFIRRMERDGCKMFGVILVRHYLDEELGLVVGVDDCLRQCLVEYMSHNVMAGWCVAAQHCVVWSTWLSAGAAVPQVRRIWSLFAVEYVLGIFEREPYRRAGFGTILNCLPLAEATYLDDWKAPVVITRQSERQRTFVWSERLPRPLCISVIAYLALHCCFSLAGRARA